MSDYVGINMSDIWKYSAIHKSACKVVDEQALWEQTVPYPVAQ